jgi:chromosome segregation ATPase
MADNPLSSREIAELKRLVKALKEDIDGVNLDRLIQSGSGARSLLERLRNEFDELNDDISVVASNFNKMADAASKIVKPTNEVNKSFNNLNSIASKLQAHQKGISELTEDELKQLQQQAKYEKDRLSSSAKILKDKKSEIEQSIQANIQEGNYLVSKTNLTDEELQRLEQIYSQNEKYESQLKQTDSILQAINKTISDQDNGYDKITKAIQQEQDELNEINTLLGLSSNIVEGVNAAFNKLGFSALASNLGITKAKNEMENTAKSIALAGGNVNSLSNKFKVLNAGISSMGSSLKTNLTNPLTIAIFLGEQLAEALKISDTATGDLAKQFDLTYQSAANVRNELNDMANFSNDLILNTFKLSRLISRYIINNSS